MLQWKSMENGLVLCDLKTENKVIITIRTKSVQTPEMVQEWAFIAIPAFPNNQKSRIASENYAFRAQI